MVFSAGASGVDLGVAYAKIRVDLNDLQSDMRSAQRIFGDGLRSIGPSIQNLGQQISGLGSALTVVGAPLLAAGGIGLKAAADFEVLTRQISIFGGVAGEELEKVRAFALRMGAQTMFSASDAATALLDMLKAGMSTSEAMASLEATLNLAAAGQLGLAQASGFVTSAMAQFGLGAADAGRIATALVQAANASRAEVTDLGLALENVGPIASSFGLSIEDVSAVLAVFSQNGIDGAEAGTQLRSMLLNMTETTETTQGAWNALGISLYDANGNVRDFNTVIKELDEKLDALPLEQQNQLMRDLGGAYGIMGLTALRSAGGLDDMRRAMGESADAAEVSEGMMGTFTGTIEELRGSLETLWINTLTPMIEDALKPFIRQVIELVNGVNEWVIANPELAQSITRVLGVVAALGPALFTIGKVIGLIGALLNPAGLIITGLTLLYSAFETNFLGIRDLLGPIVETIGAGLSMIGEAIQFFILDIQEFGLGEAILDLFGRGTMGPEMGQGLFSGILQAFGMTSEAANAFVDGLFDTFTRIGNFIQTQVLPPLQLFADWFTQTALPAVVNFVTGTVVPAVQNFFGWLGQVWNVVGPALGAIFAWFTQTALPAVVGFIQTTVQPAIDNFAKLIGGIWAAVSPALSSLFAWFQTDGLPIIQRLIDDAMNNFITPLANLISGIWERVQPGLQSVFDWFVETGLPEIGSFIDDVMTNTVTPFINTIADIWHTISEAVGAVLNWFTVEGLPAIDTAINNTRIMFIDPLIAALQNIWESVRPGIEALRDGINGALGWIDQNVIAPLRNAFYELQRLIAQITGQPAPPPPTAAAAPPTPGTQPTVNDPNVTSRGTIGRARDTIGIVRRAGVSGWRDAGGFGSAGELYMLSARANQEAYFVPPADGYFMPNFDQLLAQMAQGGGGPVFENVVVNANNAREGREAADAFMQRIQERYRERA